MFILQCLRFRLGNFNRLQVVDEPDLLVEDFLRIITVSDDVNRHVILTGIPVIWPATVQIRKPGLRGQ